MSSSSLAMSIDIESHHFPTPLPAKLKSAFQHLPPTVGNSIDLEMLPMQSSHSLPRSPSQYGGQIATSQSNSGGDDQRRVVEQMQTLWNPPKNKYRVLAACLSSFANGMNDSAPGALIASIERYVAAASPLAFGTFN